MALLAAFPEHAHQSSGGIESSEVKRGKFGVAKAAAVKQFQNQRVPLGPGSRFHRSRRVHGLVQLACGRYARQAARQARA